MAIEKKADFLKRRSFYGEYDGDDYEIDYSEIADKTIHDLTEEFLKKLKKSNEENEKSNK